MSADCSSFRASRKSMRLLMRHHTARNTDIGDLIQAGENTYYPRNCSISAPSIACVSLCPCLRSIRRFAFGKASRPLNRRLSQGTVFRNDSTQFKAIDPLSRTLRIEVDIDNPKGLMLPRSLCFCASLPFPLPLIGADYSLKCVVVSQGRSACRYCP